jgi:hypothetical protein
LAGKNGYKEYPFRRLKTSVNFAVLFAATPDGAHHCSTGRAVRGTGDANAGVPILPARHRGDRRKMKF